MPPMDKNYIVSERFIWDELLVRASAAVDKAKEMWMARRRIPTMILSWPAESIVDDHGNAINDVVALVVPTDIPLLRALTDITTRTKSYALLVCTSTDKEIKIVLESHHGVRCWVIPIERHGDVDVLGEMNVSDNAGGYRLLWNQAVLKS